MGRILGMTLLAGLLSSTLVEKCTAQHISFSFGHGHHHHHGWHYDHCWHDPYWWGPHVDYVYVAPPPRVIYVQPRATELQPEAAPRAAAPQPWSAPRALAGSEGASTLQIWNGGNQKIPVAFLVDSRQVELSDGQSHSLHGGGTRVVEFDRGGAFGTARLELTGGEYEFVITGRGWDLVPKKPATSGISLRPLVKKNVLPGETATR